MYNTERGKYYSSNTIDNNTVDNEKGNDNIIIRDIIEPDNTITNNISVKYERNEILKNDTASSVSRCSRTANIIDTSDSTINKNNKIINNINTNITSREENCNTVVNNNDINNEADNNCELVIYKVQDEHSNIVCKIIEKSYALNKRCLLLCRDEEEVNIFDSKLWTYSKLSFMPHGSKYSLSIEDAIHCNTWISEDLVYINNPDYLINLGCEMNYNINYNFTKMIEITCNEHDNIDTIKSKYNIKFNKCNLYIRSNNRWIYYK